MPEVYRADPSTGEVFETRHYDTPEEKKTLLDGVWMETPRWKYHPNPNGPDGNNPYERTTNVPLPAYPRVVHGAALKTHKVKDAAAHAKANADGWTDQPQPEIWQRGETVWTIHTIAERQLIQEQNAQMRKDQRMGVAPNDPDLLWNQVDATADDAPEPEPEKRKPGRPRKDVS